MSTTGIVKKVDDFEGMIAFVCGEQVLFERIMEKECDLFKEIY